MGPRNQPSGRAHGEVTSRWPDHPAHAPIRDRLKSWFAKPWFDKPWFAKHWLAAGLPTAAAGISVARIPLVAALAIFALAFLLPAWPWLSGAVTIPWDAK